MQKSGVIRNALAGLMVLLFAFSITPKILLHDLIADHKDRPIGTIDSKTRQFDASGYHCHCDDLVVESPFLDDCFSLHIKPIADPGSQYCVSDHLFHFTPRFYFALRGPPVNS
jgi:hypothetical protein